MVVAVSSTMAHMLDKGMYIYVCNDAYTVYLHLFVFMMSKRTQLVRMICIIYHSFQPTNVHTRLSTILAMFKSHCARGICTATLPSCTFSNRKIFFCFPSCSFIYACHDRVWILTGSPNLFLIRDSIMLTFNKQSSESAVYPC